VVYFVATMIFIQTWAMLAEESKVGAKREEKRVFYFDNFSNRFEACLLPKSAACFNE